MSKEQEEKIMEQRREIEKEFANSHLTGKYLTRRIDDNTFINFADFILNNLENAKRNIEKIRVSLSILKDGQAVFTNLEKCYIYRYVFAKGISSENKIELNEEIVKRIPEKQYLDLLLLADEQENMIDRYLDKGKMYVLDDNGIKCECIVTDEGSDVLEIKNIATVPDYQGKGYAKSLIDFIVGKYREQYAILQVGTGDSPLTIPFYEKCGFVRSHIIPNFFTDNYDHPIYEDGVQLVDMVYLQRPL